MGGLLLVATVLPLVMVVTHPYSHDMSSLQSPWKV